jgi:Caspase domain
MSASDHALLVGIDGYSRFDQLRGAESDARALKTWLLDHDGGNVPPENVTTILSSDYPPPTYPTRARPMADDVRAELERLVEEYLDDGKRRRRLYLYLAGHGFSPTIDETALLMANAGPQTLHHLPGVRYGNYFRQAPVFSEIVLMMDCCRDHHDQPPLVDVGLPPMKPRSSEAPYFFAFATKWTLRTREDVDASGEVRGHFTRALIEALDQPNATSDSVRKHIVGRLPELSRRGEYYAPEFRSGKTISFGKRTRRDAEEPPCVVNVVFANPDASVRLSIIDGDDQIVAEADMDSSPWSVPLARGLYELARSDRRERTGFRVPATGSIDVQA